MGKGVNVSEVRGERVPEFGSRAAESSATHGAEPGGGHREMEGGGRPEGARGGGDVEEIRQVGGGEVVNGLESVQQDFEVSSELDGEPVKLLEDGGDVMKGGGSGDDPGCRVLNHLEFMEGFVGGTKEE